MRMAGKRKRTELQYQEKENEEDRVKEDAVASSEMEQKAPQKEDSGIDNQDKNTEKPMDSTDFKMKT